MTIIPGSLDHLYYNGIIDHIPYEAYEMAPVMHSTNAHRCNHPLCKANNMKGQIYGNYGNSYDSFVGTVCNPQMYGVLPSMSLYSGGYGGVSPYSDWNALVGLYGVPVNPYYGLKDAFVHENCGCNYSHYNSFNESIKAEAKDAKEGVLNSHPGLKGLLSLGILLMTPFLLLKGIGKGKQPVVNSAKKSFWSRLNPKNWFKNNSTGNNSVSKSSFWSKLNPKNWGKNKRP